MLCARPKERDREDGWTEREREREREGERRSSGKGKESERTAAGRGKLAPSRLANIFFFSLSLPAISRRVTLFFSVLPLPLFVFSRLPPFPLFFFLYTFCFSVFSIFFSCR